MEEARFSISVREITFRKQELNWLFAKYKRHENNPLYIQYKLYMHLSNLLSDSCRIVAWGPLPIELWTSTCQPRYIWTGECHLIIIQQWSISFALGNSVAVHFVNCMQVNYKWNILCFGLVMWVSVPSKEYTQFAQSQILCSCYSACIAHLPELMVKSFIFFPSCRSVWTESMSPWRLTADITARVCSPGCLCI